MHKVKIQVVELEVVQGFVQTRRDVLCSMVGKPQLEIKEIK